MGASNLSLQCLVRAEIEVRQFSADAVKMTRQYFEGSIVEFKRVATERLQFISSARYGGNLEEEWKRARNEIRWLMSAAMAETRAG